jgi:ABC-2 type transport system permease protein
MSARESIWRLFRVELRLFMREPAAVFFSLLFPAILGLIINAAIGHYKAIDGFRVSDVNVPAILAIALANIGLMSVPIVIAEYKERAILKRYQTTPISLGWLLSVLVLVSLMMFIGAAALVIFSTWIFFGLHFAGNPLMIAAVALVAGLSFTAFGLMLGGLLSSARTAQAVGSVLFFPLLFLSGAVFPVDRFPHGLQIASDFIPLTYLVKGLSYTWIGQENGQQWAALGVMIAMAAVSLAIARRTFRWT